MPAVESAPLLAPESSASKWRARVLLNALPGGTSLHGIVDAARDEHLYDALHAEPKDSQVTCLYDGTPAIRYGRYAPYLITLHQGSSLFKRWLGEGWNAHWGIFVASRASISSLKRHLKHFLTGTNAQGQKIWLRFYDPQVLPGVLSNLSPGNLHDWFGGGLVQACLAPCSDGLWRGMPQHNLMDKLTASTQLRSDIFKVDAPC